MEYLQRDRQAHEGESCDEQDFFDLVQKTHKRPSDASEKPETTATIVSGRISPNEDYLTAWMRS